MHSARRSPSPRTSRTRHCACSATAASPQQLKIAFVIVLSIFSVAFSVAGPKILGHATNVLFAGRHRRSSSPPARPRQQVDRRPAGARARPSSPTCSPTIDFTPGDGVDFAALAQDPARCSRSCTCSARSSGGCRATSWPASRSASSTRCAATSTRSSRGCRCKYFDDHSRGDILSRVTNDIDNIANTLQQSLTQIITAVFTGHRRARR